MPEFGQFNKVGFSKHWTVLEAASAGL